MTAVHKTLGGLTFQVVDPMTYPHGNFCFDEEEPILAPWLEFRGGSTVVDVGACFGSFTMPALAAGARVVAFEPSDDGERILRENVALNGWSARCDVRKCAVFDVGSTYPAALHDSVFRHSYPAAYVVYSTLDSEIREHVDAIKIDVEGGELGVLRGAMRILSSWHPTLLIEDHEGINHGHIVSDYPTSVGSRSAILSLLSGLGYSIERAEYACNRGYIIARA